MGGDNDGNKPKGAEELEPRVYTFEEVVTPDHLKMVSRASGGFTFREDPTLPPYQTGYTNKETKTINFNPLLRTGSKKLGIKPWTPEDIRGFTYHEAGHHAKEVLEFDQKLIADLKNPEVVPKAYQTDPDTQTRFIGALYRHLDNALVDIWLESYMGRRPFYPVRESITSFQSGKGEPDTYRIFSKPEQLMQCLLKSPYFSTENAEAKLDPDVYEAFRTVRESGAMKTLLDRQDFENYFASDREREMALARKYTAYKQVFLPEYLKLVEAEIEERKKKKKEEKDKQEGAEPKEGGRMPQQGEGEGETQQTPDAVPLTKEEEQEILEKFLKELEGAGEEHQLRAPSPEEEKELKQMLNEIKKVLIKIKEGGEKPEKIQPKKTGEEAIRELSRELQRLEREKNQRGLAESMQVREESVRQWEQIKKDRRIEIESLASSLSEIFLDDRRKRIEYLKREGEIVPGLEYETVAALLSGELDPDTKMREVANPEFLETEIEFLVDTSGSMEGNKIRKSVELMVIVTEALRKVREDIEGENLLAEDEEPLRVGVTKFEVSPERVTRLSDPMDARKEILIIDKASMVGGGTDESGAIAGVYGELRVGKHNVLKIMITLTDGAGNRAAVNSLIRQIENDNEVVFLAIGLGDSKENAEAIIETYVAPLRRPESNVFGMAAENPDEILPKVLEFLKREVEKRRPRL